MKVKPGFLLQIIAGNPVIVPLGVQLTKHKGLFKLNSDAAFLFEKMQANIPENEIIDAFAAQFGTSREESREVYTDFIASLCRHGIAGETDECLR
jgi:hypothetical protein